MFLFDDTDDGLYVTFTETGKAVARVETKSTTYSDHVDGDPKKPKLAAVQAIVKDLPPEDWKIHFCAHRFTLEELSVFHTELSAKCT